MSLKVKQDRSAISPGMVGGTVIVTVLLVTSLMLIAAWPGWYPSDAFSQWHEATSGRLTDWHPPLMTVMLSLWSTLGGTMTSAMAVQSILGAMTLLWACYAMTGSLHPSNRARNWMTALIGWLIFVMPVSPLPFYWFCLSKDTWLLIGLCGLISLTGLIGNRANILSPLIKMIAWAVWLILALSLILIRHNALVMLPALCLLAGYLAWCLQWRRPWLYGLIAILILLTVSWALPRMLRVEHRRITNVIMAVDLVGMCVWDPSARADLPYTDKHLRPHYRQGYIFGSYIPLYLAEHPITDPQYTAIRPNPELKADYWRAITHRPYLLARVKLAAVWYLLNIDRTIHWVYTDIADNKQAIKPAAWNRSIHEPIRRLARFVPRSPLRWISGVNALWLVIGLALAGYLLHQAATDASRRRMAIALLLLLAAAYSYSGSYLLAVTARDFRFMYPTTLVIQLIGINLLVAMITHRMAPVAAADNSEEPKSKPSDSSDDPAMMALDDRPANT